MKLMNPLQLDDVQTGEVTLVPTKKFFKPVVVMSCPLTPENAKLLGVDYLFDQQGNPHPFEGAHRLTGELSGAVLTFVSKQSGEVVMATEKVSSMGCQIEEKTGMRLKLHAHLPESQEQFIELLNFLAKLNKEKFELVVRDEQRSLFEAGKGGPATEIYEKQNIPFTIKIGTKPALVGFVETMAVQGGFVGGWECKGIGLSTEPAGGNALKESNPVRETQRAALVWAVQELFYFVKQIDSNGPKEIRAIALMSDWCIVQAPELKKESAPPAVETQEEPVH